MNGIQVFRNDEFGSVRVVERDGEPWFVATDVAHALGMRDGERITRSLNPDEKATTVDGTPGGRQTLAIISEPGFYRTVLRKHSRAINSPEVAERVERFQRWVTHEVLPAIRRSGGYMVDVAGETPEQTMARALLIAQETMERQRARIEEMAPKALFADAVTASRTSILVGELAKLLSQNGVDTGQNRLFETLRNEGYLMKSGSSRNMPTQMAMDMGLFEIKETTVVHSDGHITVSKTPKVTGKGQVYFVNRYCNRNTIKQGA